MAIPFLSYFKKKAKPEPVVEVAPLAPPVKAAGERMRKTVTPSAPRQASEAATTMSTYAPASSAAATGPRTVSFGPSAAASRAADIPPAVALALEPNVERTISLELADIVEQIPEGFVRALEAGEGERRVLLKASELERGMANGKPTVSLGSIYEQVPDVFVRSVASNESTQVTLPFSVVLEQFSSLQTRSDQHRAAAVPQVQTPFLKVTMEDSERFGTAAEMPDIADLPTVRVEPATAQTIAAAEPEPAAKETLMSMPPPKASKPFSLRPVAPDMATNGNGTATPAAPARIPFKLTPNGTDVPASERVPASNGPSVPTSLPAAPTRIPFKVTAPSDDVRPKSEPWMTKATLEAEAATGAPAANAAEPMTEATISLPLRAILEMLPPMQLVGDIDEVASGTRVEFPFALVEPQLVTGRVTIQPEQLAAALPAEYHGLFNAEAQAPVSLPLQEVLKNLPGASLRMRDDQEEQEKGANFDTPFSAKAAEDAKRLQVAATPVAKPVAVAAPAPTPAPITPVVLPEPVAKVAEPKPAAAESPAAPQITSTATGDRSALQVALDTDDVVDAKSVVAHVGKMEGVKACAIMFGDGLSLAGNLPDDYDADGLCAMAPSMLQRIENHMVETQLGALRAMTLSCAKAAITFFMHDNLCLAALHGHEQLGVDTRDRLGRTVQALSRQYSHPA
jgi:predicted regulator of Ras-like GTPase activity (Roadblock/LC7/MglB family)